MSAIELNARASTNFADKLDQTQGLLRRAAKEFSPLTQASSLGAEDVVITHLINSLQLRIPIFVLETGALHHETLALLERTLAHSQADVHVYRPEPTNLLRFIRNEGQTAIFKTVEQRKACCQIRKMEPLSRALRGQRAWITGLRKEQSLARSDVPLIDTSEETQTPDSSAHSPSRGLVKFNPLANWTWGDVWHYIAIHKVDYNPLHDAFYPSIGCSPCTRAISQGEDLRAGRWWWEEETAKECGLHVKES
jgi:phosphoadenosine phosphosulfate reductase